MPQCPQCDWELAHIRRTRLQRFVYSRVYFCKRCRISIGRYYRFLHRQLINCQFLFSLKSRCVRCGSRNVQPTKKRDYIDPVSKDLLGSFQRLFGAPLKKCPACRLQFYDWRPARPGVPKPAAQASQSAG